MRRILLFFLISLIALSCASPSLMAQAPSAPAEPTQQETLEAILTELKALREDIQATSLLGAKLQLATLRVGIQEERVARASDALAQVQSDLKAEVELRASLTARAKQLEAEYDTTGGSEERRSIAARIDELKTRAASPLVEDGLRAREGEATTQLQSAQADLARVQSQLDDVERSIDRTPGR